MRVKLRYALPGTQMALAVGLLWWSDRWFKTVGRFDDMPGPAPASRLCFSLNAPVVLVQNLRIHYASALEEYVAVVVAVGVLWYWVALNAESWRRNRTVLGFHWIPLRLAVDLLLIAAGAFWGLAFAVEVHEVRSPYLHWSGWLWLSGILGPLLAWSIVLIFFFGRDFVLCLRKKASQ
jgi:hypothetical protein